MNTADLWFRGDSFWPGALWRIPGLEVPQIEAEMRAAAAWNITRKFVDRLVASPRTRRRARSEPSKPGTVGWNWRHAGKSRNRGFGPALASAPQERSESPASGLAVMFVLSGDRPG